MLVILQIKAELNQMQKIRKRRSSCKVKNTHFPLLHNQMESIKVKKIETREKNLRKRENIILRKILKMSLQNNKKMR